MEEWRDIQGYEGLYQVSNEGRVRSLDRIIEKMNMGKIRKHLFKGRLLKPHIVVKYGKKRLQVGLSKEGNKKFPIVGRLVYEAFVGTIPNGMQLNHIDEDPSNNKVENLNLMTPKENSNWGTRSQRLGETFKKNGKRSKPLDQIDSKTGEVLNSFPSAKEAARQLGVGQCNISRCCNGGFNYKGKWININNAYDFIWKYILK